MISVVIQTSGEEEALVGTLTSLVGGAADGAVREVVVVDGGHTPGVELIADAFGCAFLRGPKARNQRLAIGAEAARSPWLLFLAPGVELDEGWFRDVRQFIERAERSGATDRAASFRLEFDDGGNQIWRRVFGAPAGRYGLFIHRDFYRRLGGFREMSTVEYVDFVRRIGRSRMTKLRAGLFIAAAASADDELGPGLRGLLGRGLLTLRVPARLVARLYA